MYILPTLSIDSVFSIVALVLLILLFLGLAFLLVAIHRFLSKWLEYLQAGKIAGVDDMKQDAYRRSAAMVDSAREKSLKLIQEANLKAKSILTGAGNLSEESRASIDSALQDLASQQENLLRQTSTELMGSYEEALQEQKDIGLHTIKQATKKIEGEVMDEISQFEDIVHKETVESEKLVEEKVNKDYAKVKGEIEKYKAEEMAKIDESVFNILKEVSTQVLGKALSMEGHRDLVLDALNEAKKRNFFEGKYGDIRR